MSQYNVQLQDGNGPLAGFRNQIINGDFRIWQRGTSFDPSTWGTQFNGGTQPTYTADRMQFGSTSATLYTGLVTRTDSVPDGFQYGVSVATSGPPSAPSVEASVGVNGGTAGPFAAGSTWTISFYSNVDWSSANTTVRLRSGPTTATNGIDVASVNWELAETLTDGSGYNRYKGTFTVPSGLATTIADHKCLTWFMTSSLLPYSYTGVQLEPGPVATPFEHRPIGTEFTLCQRYYQVIGYMNASLYKDGGISGQVGYEAPLPVPMRATPSIVQSGTTGFVVSGSTSTHIRAGLQVGNLNANYPFVFKLDAEL